MTARSIRRAQERKAKKLARKSETNQVERSFQAAMPAVQPVSEAQVAANRANAQLSTGPSSNEGKATSCLNAVKTGLTGRTVLLHTDDAAEYQHYLAAYEKEFSPVGQRECDLVQSSPTRAGVCAVSPVLNLPFTHKAAPGSRMNSRITMLRSSPDLSNSALSWLTRSSSGICSFRKRASPAAVKKRSLNSANSSRPAKQKRQVGTRHALSQARHASYQCQMGSNFHFLILSPISKQNVPLPRRGPEPRRSLSAHAEPQNRTATRSAEHVAFPTGH